MEELKKIVVIWLCVLMVLGGFSVTLNFENVAKGKDVGAPRPTAVDVTFDIPVQLGWNFISVPLVQYDTDILEVLDDHGGDTDWNVAQYYDVLDGIYKSYNKATPGTADLHDVNHTMGLFLQVTNIGSDSLLTVNGTLPPPTLILLYEGWNMVGYPAIDDSSYNVTNVKASTKVDIVENYTQELPDDYVLKRGEGYWFNVIENCTWMLNPIRINSNSDFDEAHGVTGGTGTEANPWIIENYYIDGSGYGYCIYIGNTTDYFVVRNCSLRKAGGFFSIPYFMRSGLHLYDVRNGRVEDNNVSSNHYGIYLYESSGNTIDSNNASGNLHGIFIDRSDSNTVNNNTANSNTKPGIHIYKSSSNTIANNTVSNNDAGISLRESSNYNTVCSNTVLNNVNGIHFEPSDNIPAIGNTMYHNNIVNNTNQAPYDEGPNYWDNGYPSGGNYWYDLFTREISVDNESFFAAGGEFGFFFDKNESDPGFLETVDIQEMRHVWQGDWSSASTQVEGIDYVLNRSTGWVNISWGPLSLGDQFYINYTYKFFSESYVSDIFSGPDQDTPGNDSIGDAPYLIPGGASRDHYPLMTSYDGEGIGATDDTPPNSTVDAIAPYWHNVNLTINATASDAVTGVVNVTLWYRHSADNSTWGANQSFGTDTAEPWNWTFDFPDSEGYYEFYSIAVDNASNPEAVPVSADTSCAYDNSLPVITLNSPANNSIIQPGTTVNLTVDDVHLDAVNYSVNGSADLDLSPPYDIETTGWTDGAYDIEVRANDIAGNTAVSIYTFTIDSTCPTITLNSPANGSAIQPGTVINLTVTDEHLDSVNYSVDGAADQSFTSPYDIETTGWVDGIHTIDVHAIDEAGNAVARSYTFTLESDTTAPTIVLNSPDDDSRILPGTTIDFTVADTHLDTVNYSVNGGALLNFTPPYDIDTTGWADGTYTIMVRATDEVCNIAVAYYNFTIDGTAPTVVSTVPVDDATGVALDTTIVITFSEAMNNVSVQNVISTTPTITNLGYSWNTANTVLTLTPPTDLAQNTEFTILVGTGATDLTGNHLASEYSFSFTTAASADDGVWDANYWYVLIGIILAVIALAVFFFMRKPEGETPEEEPAPTEETEEPGTEGEPIGETELT